MQYIRKIGVWLLIFVSLPISAATDKMPVVVSFSILADIVKNVGGDYISVTTLVGPDQDSHGYQPTPKDSRALKEAKLVVINGLGFETWMNRLMTSSGYKGPILTASQGIKPLEMKQDGHGHKHDHSVDPHAWQSLSNVVIYTQNIANQLSKMDPENATTYQQNARRYQASLNQLDQTLLQKFGSIPIVRRRILTSHGAFAYFGDRYGLTIVSVQGVIPEAEPSAADMARLIRLVKSQNIQALFVESTANKRLLQQISKETSVKIGGQLYSDALSNKARGPKTYLELIRHNSNTFLRAIS